MTTIRALGVVSALIAVVVPAFAADNPALANPEITLSPAEDGRWRASYRFTEPTDELVFVRPSNGGRAARVVVEQLAFEFIEDGDREIIRRRDGQPFDSVSLTEPTSYDRPAKGYLPFSVFGDGGLLVYTGRFHACAEKCGRDREGDEGPWRVVFDAGPEARLVANGEKRTGVVRFLDRADGVKIYLGDGDILEREDFLAVIDRALPADIRADLDDAFPAIMAFFAERLGRPKARATLFASYNTPGVVEGSSIKGGTLPNQVFMHFEGAQLPDFAASGEFAPFLKWFFAHEAAHLHQFGIDRQREQRDSWIHEGGADALAALALSELGLVDADYLSGRIDEKATACIKSLQAGSLRRADERGDFQVYYDCGMIFQLNAAAAMATRGSGDLFALWRGFSETVKGGAPWSAIVFTQLIENEAGPEAAAFARDVISARIKRKNDPLAEEISDAAARAKAMFR